MRFEPERQPISANAKAARPFAHSSCRMLWVSEVPARAHVESQAVECLFINSIGFQAEIGSYPQCFDVAGCRCQTFLRAVPQNATL